MINIQEEEKENESISEGSSIEELDLRENV